MFMSRGAQWGHEVQGPYVGEVCGKGCKVAPFLLQATKPEHYVVTDRQICPLCYRLLHLSVINIDFVITKVIKTPCSLFVPPACFNGQNIAFYVSSVSMPFL